MFIHMMYIYVCVYVHISCLIFGEVCVCAYTVIATKDRAQQSLMLKKESKWNWTALGKVEICLRLVF